MSEYKPMLLSLEDPTLPQEAWTVIPVRARPSTTNPGYFKVLENERTPTRYVPGNWLTPFPSGPIPKSAIPKRKVNVGDAGKTVVSVVDIPHLGGTRKPSKR
jgi:hypothetical protein